MGGQKWVEAEKKFEAVRGWEAEMKGRVENG